MSENTPDLAILRNQLAYQNEYANVQGEVTGEFVGRFIEAESKYKLLEKAQVSLQESLSAYQKKISINSKQS